MLGLPCAGAAVLLPGGSSAASAAPPSFSTLVPDLLSGARELVYVRTLGAGSYKEVWEVALDGEPFALTTQRLSNINIKQRKKIARNVMAELDIAAALEEGQDAQRFTRVLAWWAQTRPMKVGAGGALVPATSTSAAIARSGPTSQFVYALKPLFDADLRVLAAVAAPWPEGTAAAGVDGSEEAALVIVGGLLAAGAAMHARGVVHADIKPANLMLQGGAPRIIDLGYAARVRPGRVCLLSVRGEPEYVRGEDVARGQTCCAGDVYAMGKSLYETLFVYSPPFREPASFEAARVGPLTAHLRAALAAPPDDQEPRFRLSGPTEAALLGLLRGMCAEGGAATTFEAALGEFRVAFPDVAY